MDGQRYYPNAKVPLNAKNRPKELKSNIPKGMDMEGGYVSVDILRYRKNWEDLLHSIRELVCTQCVFVFYKFNKIKNPLPDL